MRHVAEPFQLVQPLPVWTRCRACNRSLIGVTPVKREFVHAVVQFEIETERRAPWDRTGAFDVTVTCARCKTMHIASGEFFSFEDMDDAGNTITGSTYRPRWLWPVPPMLELSKRVPISISRELERAAGLFWPDPSACLTALRRATEAFLDAQRVPRQRAGARGFIPLHHRIDDFARRLEQPLRDEFRACLHAIKDAGNDSTHGRRRGTPFARDYDIAKQIRDTVELLERILALKYGAPPKLALDAAMRRLKARDRRAAPPRGVPQG